MPYPGLAERLADVRARIAEHQARAGGRHPVTIVAVTKTHPPEAVRAALAAGLDGVGENRVQEALAKQDAAGRSARCEWHLIGTLQRNKARLAVESLRPDPLGGQRRAGAGPGSAGGARARRQPVLVQVNCSGEPQKGGVEPGGAAGAGRAMSTAASASSCAG